MFSLRQIFSGGRAPRMPAEYIIAGLGNPGPRYEGTRHNAGFMAIDLLARELGVRIDRMKFKSLTAEAGLAGVRVLLIKPQTFMNLSGEAIRDAAAFYRVPPEHIVILHDDAALPPGRLRVRASGSDGGNNGLKSIIYHMRSDKLPRVKIGIGGPPHRDYDMKDWVTGRFTDSERRLIDRVLPRAVSAVRDIVTDGCEAAAGRHNGYNAANEGVV